MNRSEGTTPRWLVVDGHAYAYRAFHAIRELTSPEGLGTNAVYGFIKMLAKMRARVKPSHLVVIWDGGLAPARLALHPEYKAQRPAAPVDLHRQIDEIQTYLEAAGLASWQQDEVEADDLIATVTRLADEQGHAVVIASADKDFMQLVSPQVGMLNPNDKTEAIWGAAEVRAKTGVEPGQVLDWLCLLGDSVDNIPGVPGVGPKTAADLLLQFGSVTAIYERLAEVKSDRIRAALQTAKDLVEKNQRLIRLDAQVAEGLDLAGCEPKSEQTEVLAGLFRRWGFNSMLRELEARLDLQPSLL